MKMMIVFIAFSSPLCRRGGLGDSQRTWFTSKSLPCSAAAEATTGGRRQKKKEDEWPSMTGPGKGEERDGRRKMESPHPSLLQPPTKPLAFDGGGGGALVKFVRSPKNYCSAPIAVLIFFGQKQ